MNPKRAQLLSDGYVILRQVVPPGNWIVCGAISRRWWPASGRRPGMGQDAAAAGFHRRPGGPVHHRRLRVPVAPQHPWVSAEVLDCPVEAVASNQALVICNPEFSPEAPPRPGQHWGTDPRNWHRDVRPDRDDR